MYLYLYYMVKSKIDSTIEYTETMKVEDEDKNQNYDMYQIKLFGLDILTTIGQPKNIKNIIYFPLYLIKYNRKVLQIGLYEITKQIVSYNLIDNTNLLDFIAQSNMLLYSFVNIRFIKSLYLSPEHYELQETESKISNEEDRIKYNSDQLKQSIFKVDNTTERSSFLLDTETLENATTIRNNYIPKQNSYWVNNFMKNSFYSVQDNKGSGDCFFYTIIDAFKTIGQYTTVANLRQIVSDHLTDDVFNEYFTLYNQYQTQLNNYAKEKKKYELRIKQLKENVSDDRASRLEIKDEISQLNDELRELKENNNVTKELIEDVAFMKNIRNVNDFKNYIKSSSYYADNWAIGILEYALNIKMIILSHDEYSEKNMLGVLRCQDVNPNIEQANSFNPDYYIIADYGSVHYELIKYKDKGIFKFSELPYDIKVLIVDKCMERMAGTFNYIKDFIDFKEEHTNKQHTSKQHTSIQHTNIQPTNTSQKQSGGKKHKYDDDIEQILSELYQFGTAKLWDDDIKLLFYNNSSNSLPGKSLGEFIPKNKILEFKKLSKIKNWRKKLDNSWIQPFIIDGKTWASVEHYYQASKYKHNPEIYNKFSMDSDSSLSKNVDKARNFYSEIDESFDPKLELYTAQEAKFLQHDDLAEILIETNMANLFNQRRGKPALQSTNLMVIRKKILNQI